MAHGGQFHEHPHRSTSRANATGQVVEKQTAGGITYALRFRALGRRQYVTLGSQSEGWNRKRADDELLVTMAEVRRGTWRPQAGEPVEIDDPIFREFATEWLLALPRSGPATLSPNTLLDYEWQLTHHLIPFLGRHRLTDITVAMVDRYREHRVRQGKLSATSINKTLTPLGQILDVADERGLIERNPLRVNPRNRKLKASKPRAVWLDRADQVSALLDAAGELDSKARADRQGIGRRAMLATCVFGGLRVGELCALRWRDVDLAGGRLNIADSKTDAGRRYVDLLPPLRDELALHKAGAKDIDGYVFPTTRGNPRTKDNVRQRVLKPAIDRANQRLTDRDLAPLPDGLTLHKLRHTAVSLLIAKGENPNYVMSQLGHTDPAFILRLYTHAMERRDGEAARLRALVEGADWALSGTGAPQPGETSPLTGLDEATISAD
jgi:integrase